MATNHENGPPGCSRSGPGGGDRARRGEHTTHGRRALTCAACGFRGVPELRWRPPHLGAFCRRCARWCGWAPQTPEVLAAAPPHPSRRRVLVYDDPTDGLLALIGDAVETLRQADPEAARRALGVLIDEAHRDR